VTGIAYELLRFRTRDAEETTVYLTRHPVRSTRVSVICFGEPTRLDHWCTATGHPEAIVAGFFVRDPYRPLGEVRIGGRVVAHEPVEPAWSGRRACVHADGSVRLAARDELDAEPSGDLVQAGPLLVSDGRSLVDGSDPEGFSAGSGQFDSDITVGRYPRCALGVGEDELLAVRARRSTSTAAGRRRSCIEAICSTGRTRTWISRRRNRGPSSPRCSWTPFEASRRSGYGGHPGCR
jgi:hypothetical protein